MIVSIAKRTRTYFYWLSASATMWALLSGCGYGFQGGGTILPEDVRVIAIPTVENQTLEPNLGLRFTEALRSAFQRYGVVKVVNDPADADATFKARILTVSSQTRDVTSNTDISLQNQVYLTVSAELRKKNGQLLWRDAKLSNSQSYASVSDVVVTSNSAFATGNIDANSIRTLGAREVGRGQKEQALSDLLDETARQIYLQAVAEDF